MRTPLVKLTREEALKHLGSFITEHDAGWERDGLDWAPALLEILREFSRQASKQAPDAQHLEILRSQVYGYFGRQKFLKDISFVLEYLDAICGWYDS